MTLLLHPAIPKIRRYIYQILAVLDGIFPWRRQVVILAYHGIGRDEWRFSVSFNDFCRQIEQVMAAGYQPVTLEEVFAYIETEATLPKKSFAVTFDDGYRDVLVVKHFLAKKGIHPAVFVLAEPEGAERQELGTERHFLSRGEIFELRAAGWEIGCHSTTHADFSELSAEALEREVVTAKQYLEDHLGFTIRYFAYPKGFHDSRIRATVQRAGYRGALSMDDGFIGPKTDPYAVPRVGVDRTHAEAEFRQAFLPTVIFFRRGVKWGLRGVAFLRYAVRGALQQRTHHL